MDIERSKKAKKMGDDETIFKGRQKKRQKSMKNGFPGEY
jgi:hypothetical protein